MKMHNSTLKCMQQEFKPKLLKDNLKMSTKKSFDFIARFGLIYSASKTEEYLFKKRPIGNRLCYKNQQTLTLLVPKIRISGPFYLRAIRCVSRKHRPRNHRPQTSKTQTSKLRVSSKTYTFDENSLRVALIFPIVYGYWRADFFCC